MDPDLVRQQAEEEAASRRLARRAPPTETRAEPVLPMPASRNAETAPPPEEKPAPPVMQTAGSAIRAGWGLALATAASCTLGAVVGLVGGVMLGVKLQLVPLQSVAIGASTGLVLGWQLGALTLRRGGPLSWWRAYGLSLRTGAAVLVVMGAAMFVAPHVFGPPVTPNAPFAIGVFWKSMAGGAALALMLGAALVRRALRALG